MSRVTPEILAAYNAAHSRFIDDAIDGRVQTVDISQDARVKGLDAVLSLSAPAPSIDAEAVAWARARAAVVNLPLTAPDYREKLNALSEAEDALSRAALAPDTAARMEEREARDAGVSVGIALSVAYLIRDVDQPGYALEWWQAAGLTIEQCERLGLEEYDLAPIAAALEREGRE